MDVKRKNIFQNLHKYRLKSADFARTQSSFDGSVEMVYLYCAHRASTNCGCLDGCHFVLVVVVVVGVVGVVVGVVVGYYNSVRLYKR